MTTIFTYIFEAVFCKLTFLIGFLPYFLDYKEEENYGILDNENRLHSYTIKIVPNV